MNRLVLLAALVSIGIAGQTTPALSATAANKATSNKTAATKPRTSIPAIKPVQKNRLAVLRFKGPVAYDIDADEVWKLKNKVSEPTEGDLSDIPDQLQSALTDKLSDRLDSTVVPYTELKRFQSKARASANQSEQIASLANNLGAQYVLTGTIERLEFDGNTVMPDDYILIVTTKLVDTTNGQTVWSQNLRKFKIETKTRGSGKDVPAIFSSRLIPTVAASMSNSIAGALGR